MYHVGSFTIILINGFNTPFNGRTVKGGVQRSTTFRDGFVLLLMVFLEIITLKIAPKLF